MKKTWKLLIFITICEIAGSIGAIFTTPNIAPWFSNLEKPWFAPPNYLFGPVWTLLFALMGIALFLAYEKKFKHAKSGLFFFIFQFMLNILWSILFFGLHNPYYALVEIMVLLFFIIVTTVKFWKTEKWAGILMLPYIAWVSFATILNFAIWWLNS